MYSSQDLALLPVPHDSVIASFDLCNYQQLPVLDNICFGLEDGDSIVEDGQQQTSEANAATAATAAAAEPSEDLQAPPPPPPKAVQTPPQPQLPLQAPSPQPNVISIEQQLQQHQPLQQLQPLLQQQQQPSSTQYVTVLPQHQPQQPMTVIQILVPDDQCSQQQPLIVQAGPPDAPAPVLVSVPVQSVHSSIAPTAASPLPVAPLRQTLPAASAAAESLEDVETPVNQMQDLDTDGLDLREFRDLVRAFKEKRVGLGLTQTQAGMDLQAVEGQSYSQSFVCRLERMDVTVRQAKEASRILRKWLEEADHKYCFLNAGGKIVPLCYSKNVAIHAKGPARRQKRTVFPPEALKRLNEYFDVDPSPNVFHTEELAKELEVDAKTIQVWFCNRRQKWKQQQMQRQQ